MNLDDFSYITAFLIGLIGNIHCLGMCSGIVTLFSLSIEKKTHTVLIYQIYYNTGRILGYLFINIIIFLLGMSLMTILNINLTKFLKLFSNVLLISIGLYLITYSNLLFINKIEYLIWKLWSKIYPYIKNVFPIKKISHALILGFIWGHIPCGLIYSTILWSITSGSLLKSCILTFLFGIGTLPAMITIGIFSTKIKLLLKTTAFRYITSIIIITFGIINIYTSIISTTNTCH